jgi:hypothetical protein
VASFSKLRFKPNGVRRVTIPVTFTLPEDTSRTRVTRNFPATWLAESNRVQINSGKNLGRK